MLYRICHIELKAGVPEEEAARSIEWAKQWGEAPESETGIAWALVGSLHGRLGAVDPGNPTFGFVLAFNDEAGFERWSLNDDHFDGSDYMLDQSRAIEARNGLLLPADGEYRSRIETIGRDLSRTLNRPPKTKTIRSL